MGYKCNICNYETYDQSNYIRHKKSKKHLKIFNNLEHFSTLNKNLLPDELPELPGELPEKSKLICKYCKSEFKFKSGLSRHQINRCKLKNNKSIEDNELKEQNKILMEIIRDQSKIAVNNSEVTKKSMNIMTYALKHFEEAPPIGLLEDDQFDEMVKCLVYDNDGERKTDKTVEEIITFHHKKGTLVKVLGELITNEYKKSDPKKQSIWSSDISRLTFIVKDIIGKSKKSKWITDKKGIHITQTIITPMLDIVKDRLIAFVDELGKMVSKSIKECRNTENILSKMHDVNVLLVEIKLGKMRMEILRNIAPYFNLSVDMSDDSSDTSTVDSEGD